MKLNVKQTVLVGLAFFTVCVFWQLYDYIMPLFLNNFGLSFVMIGFIMAWDNILAMFMLPLFGRLSDRTRTRFGKRMPYIAAGSVLAASALLLVNTAHNSRMLWLLLLSTGFLLVFMCVYRSPAVSLMPDVTPKHLRSKANAVINIMGALGGVIVVALTMFMVKETILKPETADEMAVIGIADGNWALTGLVAGLMILAAVVMIFTVKEDKLVTAKRNMLQAAGIDEDAPAKEAVSAAKTAGTVGKTGLNRAELCSYALILTSVFLWFFGYNAATTFFSIFSFSHLGGNFPLPLLIAYAAAFVMYVPSGIIGGKIGRRRTVLLGIALMGAGFLLGAVFVAFDPGVSALRAVMFPAFILVGAGWATINVHSYVMAVELAKKGNTGLFTGLYYTFSMGAQALTPVLAGLIYGWSYKLLFFYAAFFTAASFVTMWFVKHGNAASVDKEPA
ncbi:MAG: MFS transporter [Firmicutes bacterium]|nr:MFS transporter [Bacillota bacterium]